MTGIKIKIITAVLIAAVIAAIVGINILEETGMIVPSYAVFDEKSYMEGNHEITLLDKKLRIKYKNQEIWQSEDELMVQDFILDDIDRDGVKDLLVLCFKRGMYGKESPFWVTEDTNRYYQHIYIYELYDGVRQIRGKELYIKPKWMASDIGIKAKHMYMNEGVLYITDAENQTSGWIWSGFGLKHN